MHAVLSNLASVHCVLYVSTHSVGGPAEPSRGQCLQLDKKQNKYEWIVLATSSSLHPCPLWGDNWYGGEVPGRSNRTMSTGEKNLFFADVSILFGAILRQCLVYFSHSR